jgi:hypothetical protein
MTTDRAQLLRRLNEPIIAHTIFEHPAAYAVEKAEPADWQPALGLIMGPCPARLAMIHQSTDLTARHFAIPHVHERRCHGRAE